MMISSTNFDYCLIMAYFAGVTDLVGSSVARPEV